MLRGIDVKPGEVCDRNRNITCLYMNPKKLTAKHQNTVRLLMIMMGNKIQTVIKQKMEGNI